MEYFAIIRRDDGSDFGVEFPDLPGCVSAGRSLYEALLMGSEALALHLHGLAEDGEAIPAARLLEAVEATGGDVVAVVALAPAQGITVERVSGPTGAAVELAQLVELLPDSRPAVASCLGVSESTLRGWLRAASGAVVSRRHSGGTPPGPHVIATARGLVQRHAAECLQAARAR